MRISTPPSIPLLRTGCSQKPEGCSKLRSECDLKWENPDEEGLVAYMCGENGFGEDRIRNGCKKLLKGRAGATQGRLDSFFKVSLVLTTTSHPYLPWSLSGLQEVLSKVLSSNVRFLSCQKKKKCYYKIFSFTEEFFKTSQFRKVYKGGTCLFVDCRFGHYFDCRL